MTKKKILSATLTPMDHNGKVDLHSLEKMILRNLQHGISGFMFCGSMGERQDLSVEDQHKIIAKQAEVIGNQAEKIICLSGMGLSGILRQLSEFDSTQFDAYGLLLPIDKTGMGDPVDFILKVADQADKPIYFYYHPSNMGINLDGFYKFLQHPNVFGIKNSSGDMRMRKELIMMKKDLDISLYEGHEWAIDEALILGYDGALAGMASLGSKVMVQIAEYIDQGSIQEAMQLQKDLIGIFHGVYGRNIVRVVNGHKYALKYLEVIDSEACLNHNAYELSQEEKKEIEETIDRYRDILD